MPQRTRVVRPTFQVRLLALLVDYALILGWMAALAAVTFVLSSVTGKSFDWLELGTAGAQLLGFLLLVVPVGSYLFVCESSARQATVGKQAFGLLVVNAKDGGRPSRPRILVRTVVKLLPLEIAHFAVWNVVAVAADADPALPGWLLLVLAVANLLPLVYVMLVALERNRRGPYDLAAGTRVVTQSGTDATATP